MRHRETDLTPVTSIETLAEDFIEGAHERYAEAVSDDGAPADVAKAQQLADLLTKVIKRDWRYPTSTPPTYVVTKRTKYILIDRMDGHNQGKSAYLMVGPGDRVFGTKGYGVINPRSSYGTIETLLATPWSMPMGHSHPVPAAKGKEG